MEVGGRNPETRNQKPETRNQKPETRIQNPESRNIESRIVSVVHRSRHPKRTTAKQVVGKDPFRDV